MHINTKFISDTTDSFYESLPKTKKMCKAATFEAKNNFYKKKIYQKIYALRYLPAYYFEYCLLAKELRSRLKNKNIKYVKVLSLGCGLSPDYYALKHNLRGIKFDYTGYDLVSELCPNLVYE